MLRLAGNADTPTEHKTPSHAQPACIRPQDHDQVNAAAVLASGCGRIAGTPRPLRRLWARGPRGPLERAGEAIDVAVVDQQARVVVAWACGPRMEGGSQGRCTLAVDDPTTHQSRRVRPQPPTRGQARRRCWCSLARAYRGSPRPAPRGSGAPCRTARPSCPRVVCQGRVCVLDAAAIVACCLADVGWDFPRPPPTLPDTTAFLLEESCVADMAQGANTCRLGRSGCAGDRGL